MSDLNLLKTSDFPVDNSREAFHKSRRLAREAILRYILARQGVQMPPVDDGVFAAMFPNYDAGMQRGAAKARIAIARQHLKGTYIPYAGA